MSRETIVISRKYMLIHSGDDYVVVDTGSPLSYHTSGQLSFCGISHECQTSIVGVDGIIGYELFSRYKLLYQNKRLYICLSYHLQS